MPPGSWLSCRADGGPEPATDLPAARSGLGSRGDHAPRARCRVRGSRDRRGPPPRHADPPAGAIGLRAPAYAGQPPDLPSLRPADRPGHQRLPLLRPSPARHRRDPVSRSAARTERGAHAPRGRRFAVVLVTAVVAATATATAGCGGGSAPATTTQVPQADTTPTTTRTMPKPQPTTTRSSTTSTSTTQPTTTTTTTTSSTTTTSTAGGSSGSSGGTSPGGSSGSGSGSGGTGSGSGVNSGGKPSGGFCPGNSCD